LAPPDTRLLANPVAARGSFDAIESDALRYIADQAKWQNAIALGVIAAV